MLIPTNKDVIVINSSGGLDSTVLIYRALKTTEADILLVNYTYGQNHMVEIHVQKKLYKSLKKKFGDRILGNINIDLSPVYKAGKKLFMDLKSLRESKGIEEAAKHEFYTPSRNLLFMAAASALGELVAIVQDYQNLFLGIGVHKHSEEAYGIHMNSMDTVDTGDDIIIDDIDDIDDTKYTQYWDITPEFIKALQEVLNLNNIIPITIYAPYKDKFKNSIIKDMKKFKVPFKKTWTCYNPIEDIIYKDEGNTKVLTFTPCNVCEACKERKLQSKGIIKKDINDYTVKIKQK